MFFFYKMSVFLLVSPDLMSILLPSLKKPCKIMYIQSPGREGEGIVPHKNMIKNHAVYCKYNVK